MLFNTFILLCYAHVCLAANYDIIWGSNYCYEKERYPSSYELPHNSPCSFCLNDVITLRINSTSNIYENLYRVPNETAMMNCNASTNENANVIAFNDKQEITIRSGGSEAALSFFLGNTYYFISTSDGTQTSAENDLNQPPNTCLQLAFTVLLDNNPSCGTYAANCNFTTSTFCSTMNVTPTTTTSASTTTQTTPMSDSTDTTTTTQSAGLSLVFSIDTTDSPELITCVSILLGFTTFLIIFSLIFGITFLTLFWFDRISYLFFCFHKISCPTFNYRKKREVELTEKTYPPEIGLININAPKLQGMSLDQEAHYENWDPKKN